MVHELSKADARRICVQAQLLAEPRPDDLLDVVRHLTVLQAEPTAPLGAPSADLVLWSRLGSAYDRAELRDLIDRQVLIEHQGYVRPSEDLALFRAEMSIWPGREPLKEWQRDNAAWVETNDGCRREILDELRREGPLPTGAFEDTCEVPWPSSGWNNNKNVQMMLRLMVARGEVAAAGRRGPSDALGPGRADLPRRPGPRPRRGAPAARRTPAPRARRGASEAERAAGRAAPRRRGRRARGRGGGQGRLASGAVAPGPAVRGPRRAAVAVRPAGPGPQAARPALRVRLPARDVQAGRAADLGLLRAPDPPRRPAGREARRDRRAGRRRAPGRRRCTRTSPGPTRRGRRSPRRSRDSPAGSTSR